MIRPRVVARLVLGSLVLAVAGQSTAQVRYVDEKGNSHWVGSEAQVPEQYRDKATTPALPQMDANNGLKKNTDRFIRENRGKWAAQDRAEAKAKEQAAREAAAQAAAEKKFTRDYVTRGTANWCEKTRVERGLNREAQISCDEIVRANARRLLDP